MMDIKLSDHFSHKKLLKFTLPSIIMMIFVSIYSVVDGYFVSNFVGKEAFTAVNLIIPVLMILASFGFMIGAGGSALIAKTRGEGDEQEANRLFSLFVYILSAFGVVVAVVSFIFIRPLSVRCSRREENISVFPTRVPLYRSSRLKSVYVPSMHISWLTRGLLYILLQASIVATSASMEE